MTALKERRKELGLTQEQVIDAVRECARQRGDIAIPGLAQPAYSRHENGQRKPSPRYQQLYCKALKATAVQLGFRLALPRERGHHEDVDRRAFLTGMAGVAIDAVLPTSPPIRLGGNDVARMRSVLVNSYRLDEQHGGAGAVFVLAERNFNRLRSLVSRASYGVAVGRDLRELTGMAAEHIAWLAYDAGDHDKASHWSSQALHWGRLADSDAVRVVTLASMAGQASDRMQARTAIELAAAAQSASKMTTPRLMSMLLAEEALGHATAGDDSMARRTLSRARALIGQDRFDDDPAWLEFYGPAEFASYEHKSALRLRDSATAVLAARNALALNDRNAYPRNHALYSVQLAHALIQRREIDEAATIAKRAAVLASDLDSTRVKHGILALAHSLAPYRDAPAVKSFLEPLQTT